MNSSMAGRGKSEIRNTKQTGNPEMNNREARAGGVEGCRLKTPNPKRIRSGKNEIRNRDVNGNWTRQAEKLGFFMLNLLQPALIYLNQPSFRVSFAGLFDLADFGLFAGGAWNQ